ncbi:MAG: DUF1080 domain-containing protein [Acidobacteriaceae bacterium]|jgi:hypothetical protein|nr:DUF1080 domain-containing protein [Acidobacteriaceae bacterium]
MRETRRDFLKNASITAGCIALPQLHSAHLMAAVNPPVVAGFRSLFDGRSLAGWKPQPRDLKNPSLGLWAVQNGILIGGQAKPKVGAYLTSEETFSDFELELESHTDWPTDTGVMVRSNAQGNVGFQVCIDYRPHGALVGYYGNAIGGFHACDYCFTGERDEDGNLIGLIPEKPSEPLDATHHVPLDYGVPVENFLRVWNLHGWNHYRIRCVGAVPHLTTWINGIRVAELDTAKMICPGWDPGAVDGLVGRAGHIAFEVHSNGPKDFLGNDRWAPGAVCRWRNIRIKTL